MTETRNRPDRDERPCSEPNCDRRAGRTGLCGIHIYDVADRRPKGGPCRAVNCPRVVEVARAGLCRPHHRRMLHTGRLGTEPVGACRIRKACSVDGCERPHRARGLCVTHYQATTDHGPPDELDLRRRTGPANPLWKPPPEITYVGAHGRLRRQLGPAPAHICARCGGREALHWALINGAESVTNDGHQRVSPDPSDYEPLCVPCHKRVDTQWSRQQLSLPGLEDWRDPTP